MKKGFTLIELLVVIAIIGLLSSVVFASLDGARRKAQEARKEADLNGLLTAISLYHDKNGNIPVNRTPGCNCWCAVGITEHNGGYCLEELVTDGFYSELPQSPDREKYYYFNYNSFALVATRMTPRRFFNGGTKGWHCSPGPSTGSDHIYCLNYDL